MSLEDVASVEVTGGSSRVPAIIGILKDAFHKEPSRTLNATEVISRGCALNCAMLSPIFRRGQCTQPVNQKGSPYEWRAPFLRSKLTESATCPSGVAPGA